MSTMIVESIKPHAKDAKTFGDRDLPLEERTDVTVAELEKMSLPIPAELYNGKVVFKMANPVDADIQAAISGEIYIYLKQKPVGRVWTEAHFKLWPERDDNARIPDVAFIVKERLPKDWLHYPAMAPDLAVEILSPTNNFDDVMLKAEEYLKQGTKIVWVVISSTREVIVCTAAGKHFVKDVLTAPQILPGFELPVSTIFAGITTA